MNTTYPDTSKEAFDSLNQEDVKTLHKRILLALEVIGEGTFEMIASYLNIDPSKIWKRLSELGKEKLIHRPGNKLPLKSGRNGFTWKLGAGDNVAEVYKKGTETAGDIAIKIIEHKINNQYIQPLLFKDE